MKHAPSSDATDEAVALLREALELLEPRIQMDDAYAEAFAERAERFISEHHGS